MLTKDQLVGIAASSFVALCIALFAVGLTVFIISHMYPKSSTACRRSSGSSRPRSHRVGTVASPNMSKQPTEFTKGRVVSDTALMPRIED